MERNPNNNNVTDIELLRKIADAQMLEKKLLINFPPEVISETAALKTPGSDAAADDYHDLRHLLWASIDNDDSLDLDQLTAAEKLDNGSVRILVAIADVDALVPKGSAIDTHAEHNTSTVYTAGKIYPMIPTELSTGLTSLNFNEDRFAMVVDMVIDSGGKIAQYELYQAIVRNHAKLAYNSVAAWLDGKGTEPAAITAVPGLAESIRLQHETSQKMRAIRDRNGALTLETIQTKAVFKDGYIVDLEIDEPNCAKELIEDFMIAANNSTARFLDSHGYPSIRRVVQIPDRWKKIVELAAEYDFDLRRKPDVISLNTFLLEQKKKDPLRFPDLSLTVIKLLGSGEYVAEKQGTKAPGHFSLAIRDYTHSTAPNRRYPDLITQRIVKACLAGQPSPYTFEELEGLAYHLTDQEDIITKVERSVNKSAAALLLKPRIGDLFNGLVTGVSDKGTWVRILEIPVEGKLIGGSSGVEIGERITVKLVSVNPQKGFIDFIRMRTRRK